MFNHLCLLMLLFYLTCGLRTAVISMSSRGGGAARGPNNPLNSRGGSKKTVNKIDLQAEKRSQLIAKQAEKDRERQEEEERRDEVKRVVQARKEAADVVRRVLKGEN